MSYYSMAIDEVPEKKVKGAWSKSKTKKREIFVDLAPQTPPPPTPLPPPTPTPAQGPPAQGRRSRTKSATSLSSGSSSTSARKKSRPRARTMSPSQKTKELPPAGLVINPQEPPAQGPPAQGPIIPLQGEASSSSAPWKPPAKTHAIMLEGRNAKEKQAFRSMMRSELNWQRGTRAL